MQSPHPMKPPRRVMKHGKDEPGCGFLVNVIKSLGFSETTEERQQEKIKIEQEFKRSDQRLNELVSRYDIELRKVLPLFSEVSAEISMSRERIHAVKENLSACKMLLQCRREEIKKMWTDAVQHKYVVETLEKIQALRKVPQCVVQHTSKQQYLQACKILTNALDLISGPLKEIEGLSDLRSDLLIRRQHFYQRLQEEFVQQIYIYPADMVFSSHNSSYFVKSGFIREIGTRRSTDLMGANTRVRKALSGLAQGFRVEDADIHEDMNLVDPDLRANFFIAIIIECFAMLHKVPDSLEHLRVHIQSELVKVVENTTKLLSMKSSSAKDSKEHPILAFFEIIFKQFKAIAKTHSVVLKNYLAVSQKYSIVGPQPYDLTYFWTQAQSAIQLVLVDYLDIQNNGADSDLGHVFAEPHNDINFYFLRRKVHSTKRPMFKFDKSSHIAITTPFPSTPLEANEYASDHNRNTSDGSAEVILCREVSSSRSKTFERNGTHRKTVLLCNPQQDILIEIYLPLLKYISEIENDMKHKPGESCMLRIFIDNYTKNTFLANGHNRNIQITIESICKNEETWRAITSAEEMKTYGLTRPLLQSSVIVDQRLLETKELIQTLPCCLEDLLKSTCGLLKTYREICQRAYRSIVQSDSDNKRIYSVAWLKDEDISRFLKSLPNWTDLKNSSQNHNTYGKKLQRGNFEPSEEESPIQVQQRNIREAEMLTSNLGEGGITLQEILSDINALKELAIVQESMEWMANRVSEFANDLRWPQQNYHNSLASEGLGAVAEGTIKVLTNLALGFDELANTCLLVLHLEVRVQCFHYLRSNPAQKSNSYVESKDDILEPDKQVQVLTKKLSELDEAFSSTLHPRKTKYIFEGLAHLTARILIQASNYLDTIDQIIVQRMCRNSIALQQTLSNITASREIALDQAKCFYELLCMDPEEILNSIVERGAQFTEMQYLNALQLSCKAHGLIDTTAISMYQQKLSDILGIKPSTGIIV